MARISWQQFAQSRWIAWSVVALFLVSGLFGGARLVETEKELKVSKQLTEEYRQKVERTVFELAQVEWQLQQERSKATKKTRKETRPDGTVIVEKEESDETTITESSGSSETATTTTETIDTKQSRTVEEESVERVRRETTGAQYQVGIGVNTDWGLDINYSILGGVRLGSLPLWLLPIIELNGITYTPERLGLGITWEF